MKRIDFIANAYLDIQAYNARMIRTNVLLNPVDQVAPVPIKLTVMLAVVWHSGQVTIARWM